MQATTTQPTLASTANNALRGKAIPVAAEHLQYLTFTLDNEMFAIGILSIREILEYGTVTEVPMTPPSILGAMNLRGAVVPVVDLAVRLGRHSQGTTKRTCIVIVEIESANGKQDMGVVVDAVSEVLEILPSDIEPPPEFGAHIRSEFMEGMGKVDGKLLIILNVNRVLMASEIAFAASST